VRPPPDRLVERIAVGSVGLTALVGAVAALRSTWRPAADLALIELRVRDVPSQLPLVGAYSRLGWSHPGPAWFELLAVPYRLLGSSSSALLAAAWCTTIVGVLASWWVARRLDRLAGSIVLAVAMVAAASVEATTLRNPWNPYASLVLGGTLVVLCWAVAQRRPVPMLIAPAVATLLVQAHLGALPLMVVVLAAAYALALWPERSIEPAGDAGDASDDGIDEWVDPRGGVRWSALLGGLGIAAAMWLPPIVEQFTRDPGNLSTIARSAGGSDATSGIGFALRLVSGAFAVVPTWAGARTTVVLNVLQPSWHVPVLVVIPVAAMFVAARRRDRLALRGLAICAAGVTAAIVAAARIDGPAFAHLVPWIDPVAATTVALGVWVLCRHLLPAGARSWVPTAAGSVTLIASVVLLVGQLGTSVPDRTLDDALVDLEPALLADAENRATPAGVFVDSELDFGSLAATPGVILQLERAGFDTRTGIDDADRLGAHRVGDPQGRVRYRVAPVASVPGLTADGWTVVATHDPFTGAERTQLDQLGAEIRSVRAARDAADSAGEDTVAFEEQLRDLAQQQVAVLRDRLDVAVLRRTGPE
jgi:hypothetical protein